jgi:hypothetical protein
MWFFRKKKQRTRKPCVKYDARFENMWFFRKTKTRKGMCEILLIAQLFHRYTPIEIMGSPLLYRSGFAVSQLPNGKSK